MVDVIRMLSVLMNPKLMKSNVHVKLDLQIPVLHLMSLAQVCFSYSILDIHLKDKLHLYD